VAQHRAMNIGVTGLAQEGEGLEVETPRAGVIPLGVHEIGEVAEGDALLAEVAEGAVELEGFCEVAPGFVDATEALTDRGEPPALLAVLGSHAARLEDLAGGLEVSQGALAVAKHLVGAGQGQQTAGGEGLVAETGRVAVSLLGLSSGGVGLT